VLERQCVLQMSVTPVLQQFQFYTWVFFSSYLGFFFVYIVIMTFGLCLCNAGVYISRYVPMEGQCSVNIQISVFGMCAK